MTTATTSSLASTVPSSGNRLIDGLLIVDPQTHLGVKWGGAVGTAVSVDYSFPDQNAVWSLDPETGYGVPPAEGFDPEPLAVDYAGLNPAQQSAVTTALQAWSHVANISFVLVAEDGTAEGPVGDIRVAVTDMDAGFYAYTYAPNNTAYGGDVWINHQQPVPSGDDYSVGANGWATVLHELGHAIGLDHPFTSIGNSSNSKPGFASFDSMKFTIMSYSDAIGHLDEGDSSFYPTTPMLLDIQALQYLYGANMSWAAGDDLYVFGEGQDYYETIWDAGGNDTIEYDSALDGGLIDLTAGHFSQLGNAILLSKGTFQDDDVAIAFNVAIENAVGGGGADTLLGNAGANLLLGNAGADSIQGGPGDDTLAGGADNDFLQGGIGSDSVSGGDGNDLFDGAQGADTVQGGDGNDLILVPRPSLDLRVDGGAGTDELRINATADDHSLFAASWTSLQGVERIVIGTGSGALADRSGTAAIDVSAASLGAGVEILGNDGANWLQGGSSADSIDGGGGDDSLAGIGGGDSLVGGAGLDFADYRDAAAGITADLGNAANNTGDAAGDSFVSIEGIAGGAFGDLLSGDGGANTVNGGAGDDTLLGGDGNDAVSGNADNDSIDGGAGEDQLIGGAGNDAIAGGEGNDNIIGNSGTEVLDGQGGNDTVHGGPGDDTVSGDIGDDSVVGGTENDLLLGGDGNDTLVGNAGNDALDGGAQDDLLIGGAGDDALRGGDGNDNLIANAGIDTLDGEAGNDTVHGGPGDDTVSGGTGDDSVVGGMENDLLAGGEGNDILIGNIGDDTIEGNAGNDNMFGGPGNDVFRYEATIFNSGDVTANGHDTINAAAGDLIDIHGLNDNLQVNGVLLSALTADVTVGSAIDAFTSIAFTGGVLLIDVDASGFGATDAFQMTLNGVTTVTYNATDDLFHLS
jgi:Ca2+-binding RTX toxin-like protein